jgi:hypothetical protein
MFTEDGSRRARDTMFAFVTHAARQAAPLCQTHKLKVAPGDRAFEKHVVFGNNWRSHRPDDQRAKVVLRQYIATSIARARSLVFFHFDGDVPWGRRSACLTLMQFKDEILDKVELILQRSGLSAAEASRCLQRIVSVIPFYSIEAWVYQNTKGVTDLCRKHCGHRHTHHTRVYREWQSKPEVLDELDKPKTRCCLGSRHNHDLVSRDFPWERLNQARKSFVQFVEDLKNRAEVVSLLDATA